MAYATSSTSASVASHSAEMLLIDEMRCARNALAVSFDSSALQRFDSMMRSRGTHVRVDVDERLRARARPSGVSCDADQHAVGLLEVRDRGALGQELGVRQHVEAQALRRCC